MTWSVTRIEHLAYEVSDSVDPTVFGDRLVAHFSIPALDSTGGPEVQPASEIQSAKQPLRGGEVLLSRLNPRKARVLTVPRSLDYPALGSGEFIVLEPMPSVEPRFLEYLLLAESTRQFLDGAVQSVTRSHQRIRPEHLMKLDVLVPALEQQRAIADYLDAETVRIDALIAKKQQLAGLLEERIDAMIMEVVGRSEIVAAGGEPSVEIGRVLRKLDRTPAVEEMITAFRDGQVTTRAARGKEGFTNSWTDGARVQGVRVGDVVIHGLDGFSGAIGDSEAAGICSPVYHVCEPRDGGDSTFYARLLRLLALTGYLGNFAVSTRERAVDFRNWDLVGRIPIPLVPIEQQREVGNRIRTLRPLTDLVAKSETLALERKSALISRVVTGELGVGEAA